MILKAFFIDFCARSYTDILLNVFLAIAVDNLSDEDEEDEENGALDDDNEADEGRGSSSAAAKKAAEAWVPGSSRLTILDNSWVPMTDLWS